MTTDYHLISLISFASFLFSMTTEKIIAVKRDPSILNMSAATSTAGSQASGESSSCHDKGIKGAKFIALAAENSNLKSLIAEVINYTGGETISLTDSNFLRYRGYQSLVISFL